MGKYFRARNVAPSASILADAHRSHGNCRIPRSFHKTIDIFRACFVGFVSGSGYKLIRQHESGKRFRFLRIFRMSKRFVHGPHQRLRNAWTKKCTSQRRETIIQISPFRLKSKEIIRQKINDAKWAEQEIYAGFFRGCFVCARACVRVYRTHNANDESTHFVSLFVRFLFAGRLDDLCTSDRERIYGIAHRDVGKCAVNPFICTDVVSSIFIFISILHIHWSLNKQTNARRSAKNDRWWVLLRNYSRDRRLATHVIHALAQRVWAVRRLFNLRRRQYKYIHKCINRVYWHRVEHRQCEWAECVVWSNAQKSHRT